MQDDALSYWDDDPDDPLPNGGRISLRDLVVYGADGAIDVERTMQRAEPVLDDYVRSQLGQQTAWWRRRVARERLRPNPHPDTERIAYNIEH